MKYRPIGLDFESLPIRTRPHYPPEPVSFSLQLPTWRQPKFYAWGHRTGGNNTSFADAKRVLTEAYRLVSEPSPIVCHNTKFDLEVALEWFGLPLPSWHCVQDTMFLLFLDDPHQRELGLKPSAERLLGLPPEEQDAVKAWVLSNKKQLEADSLKSSASTAASSLARPAPSLGTPRATWWSPTPTVTSRAC